MSRRQPQQGGAFLRGRCAAQISPGMAAHTEFSKGRTPILESLTGGSGGVANSFKSIGTMHARGEVRHLPMPSRKPHRECGNLEAGFGLGASRGSQPSPMRGGHDAFEDHRLLNAEAAALKVEQGQLSTASRDKRSKRVKKSCQTLAEQHRDVAN